MRMGGGGTGDLILVNINSKCRSKVAGGTNTLSIYGRLVVISHDRKSLRMINYRGLHP